MCEGFFTCPFSNITFKSDLGITDFFSKSNTCFSSRSKGLFPQRHPSRCGHDFPLQLGKKKQNRSESSQLTAKMEFKPCRLKPTVCQDNSCETNKVGFKEMFSSASGPKVHKQSTFEGAVSTNWTRHTYFPRIHNFMCEGFSLALSLTSPLKISSLNPTHVFRQDLKASSLRDIHPDVAMISPFNLGRKNKTDQSLHN
ncbi:hypothetical protein E2320_007435 [Naja naja]|nr:hypothetical protein E2320_007435 [Naja naja]